MKLLAFGDLHLGAGTALGRDPGDRLRDQEQVLDRIVELAGARGVDAVLMAGDLFEGPTITPEQLDVFMRAVEPLAGTPIICISGNGRHDLAMRSVNALQPLRHVPGVHVYSTPAVYDLGEIAIACLPWVSPARLVASMDGDIDRDRVNARAAELLVKVAAGLRETIEKPAVLMLHGSISGASLPAGISTDELREPILNWHDLVDLGFSAIVASHIHVAQWITDYEEGWAIPSLLGQPPRRDLGATEPYSLFTHAIYTGSPLPLNFGETNVPHGVWILDVDETGTRAEFLPVESRPLQQASLDLAAIAAADSALVESAVESLYDAAAWPDVDEAIVKVCLRVTKAQQRRLEPHRLRDAVIAAGAHTVKIDVDTVREERARVDGVTGDLDPLQAFDAWTAANELDEAAARAAREQMQADLEQVGA